MAGSKTLALQIIALLLAIYTSLVDAGRFRERLHRNVLSRVPASTPTLPDKLPGNWTFQGCWSDNPASRTLVGATFLDETVTIESCIAYCNSTGFIYAGVEYSDECYCDNQISSKSSNETVTDCNMPCAGNATEVCGGPDRLNLFWSGQSAPPPPKTLDSYGDWLSLGCYNDSVNARTIGTFMPVTGTMSVQKCADTCHANGFLYAGVEYADECYCSNTIASTGAPASDGCDMACAGNSTEFCGGPNRLNLYEYSPASGSGSSSSTSTSTSAPSTATPPTTNTPSTSAGGTTTTSSTISTTTTTSAAPSDPSIVSGWTSLGCYNDSVATRTLTMRLFPETNTVESCTAACLAQGYSLSGVEYADECYCDNAFKNYGAPAADGCNMPCSGDASEICGGSNRLNVYYYPPSSAASTSGTQTSTTASSTPTPSDPTTVGSWTNVGCYNDSVNARTLSMRLFPEVITVEGCTAACFAQGYVLAGLEYADECYCDQAFRNYGAPATDGCNMPCTANTSEFCGGSNRLNVYSYTPSTSSTTSQSQASSTQTGFQSTVSQTSSQTTSASGTGTTTTTSGPSDPTTVGAWSSLGCYSDSVDARTLGLRLFPSKATVEGCTAACFALDYTLAGVEYADECYCGNNFANGGAPATDGCNMPCADNATEICGGGNRLNVYQYTGTYPSSTSTSVATGPTNAPITVPSVGQWASIGCYNDSTIDRTLPNFQGAFATNTVESCVSACQNGGYTLAGMEYGQECYCANEWYNGGSSMPDGCNMACAGNSSELCGGSYRLNAYQLNPSADPPSSSATSSATTTSISTSASDPISITTTSTSTSATSTATGAQWVTLGCYNDSVNARTLGVPMPVTGQMTYEACTTACYNAGYSLAGVEYADECYCDNKFENYGAPASDGCNMPCAGDNAEMCGGSNRLNVFNYTGTVPPPSNPVNPGQPDNGAPVYTVTSGLPGTWRYSGCYVDNNHGRILTLNLPDNNALTVESCIAACAADNYTVAGMEYSTQCFCDNYVINGGTLASSESDCGMGCSGNTTEACGGPNRMTIYSSNANVTLLPVPVTETTDLPGSWEYYGCVTDSGIQRVLPYQIINTNNNSAVNCLSLCSEYGYPAAGMEYGDECYCGDIEDIVNNGGTNATETDCSYPCSGDPIHYCGGSDRLSMYTWSGAPLNVWNTPENPGSYEFFIGGIVIPLITTLNVNNKVTFIEKFGTGAPNSTGAYELDPSLADNFDLAWREMHVKTDVFCSGGVVLPDRAGRQLNVGGWSLDSTYGVRLYTPDGTPGVNGTNDWEENWQELSLQRGRWYPTAMVMANGSVLVIGGEVGSNGAPEPSLEILPTPAGGPTWLFMDWLNRTDPYNLYPFTFVLPGGGIFVVYYNEARILNEATFETTTTLPNVPGAVNNFLGGRSYPFEATGVLLPQHAPYSDPVEVLICGGSTPGPAIALDNCVTITPEVTGANWTIERMPSKRVMTCMVALPDGTFMIMNGAQQGVAGFQLGSEPNLEALLYDPTQPIGRRISKLGSTIVARMYHSEAILLQDGRVLVSGSDPEDPRFPQEYRIEVYVPPYLSAGLPQPTFSIAETDWAYGGTYTIQVQLRTGSTSTMRVSLVGATVSTHGNSMGQRTIFPEFQCAGNTCEITAPPGPHICPPGWFQLFILDGPTPSWSQWVRIGGDPAELGNWPNFPDFTRPGV